MEDGNDELLTQGGFERVTDYDLVIDQCLKELMDVGHLDSVESLDAIGFKTVLGKDLTGCVEADEKVIEALEGFEAVAPAHNPVYANGIRKFREKIPSVTSVALFETAFYQWKPEVAQRYAIPKKWHDAGVQRWGFHGASHKFIAERSAELLGRDDVAENARQLYVKGPSKIEGKPLRVISCHLGGSSSVTAIRNGVAIGCSMGFSPQSGLPQNNRVGDLDSMAIPYIAKTLDISLVEAERQLTKESGLLGVSGISNDVRDLEEAMEEGNTDAKFAFDLLVHDIRHWIGAYAFELGGVDALVFTAGIGENDQMLRAQVCEGLEEFGLVLDKGVNDKTRGKEVKISAEDSKVAIYVIPANEELVIAKEVYRFMKNRG